MATTTKAGASAMPIMRGPADAFREGPRSLKHEALAPHPVSAIQATHVKNEWDAAQFLTERVHGSAAAWERRMDRAVLSQVGRLPGGPASSHAGLDTLLGRDEHIGFEDILNLPENRPQQPRVGLHEAMEARLGLGVTPAARLAGGK